jgi:CRISPR-associated exonuclease Cas4
MAPTEVDYPIMISALQHFSYCPRQCALIHMEQIFDENVHTLRGRAVHTRVDEPTTNEESGVRVERALPLYSEKLGLVGKADVVEFHAGDIPYPVEYKHGPKRISGHDDLQLAAQAICLEEMTGKPVRHGAIYHHTSRRRREVEITDALRQQVAETVAAVRALLSSKVLPPPVNDQRCPQCSLLEICQPGALAATGKLHRLRDGLFDPDAPL